MLDGAVYVRKELHDYCKSRHSRYTKAFIGCDWADLSRVIAFTVCKTNANTWQIRPTRAPLKFVYDYSRIPLLVLSIDQFSV